MKLLALFALAISSLWAQTTSTFLAQASTTALTVQQPASNAPILNFGVADVYCASAQTATLAINGTAATATAATVVSVPPITAAARATAWSGSNVGSGTTVRTYSVGAASDFLIDLSKVRMTTQGAGQNVTISTTGTCTITFQWTEQ